jgi:tRNA (adenine37-N6)-methyltransferase
MDFTFPIIAIIHSCFKEKFGIPRQPGLAPLATAQLEFLPPYDNPAAVAGLEGCSHIWLQFVFHANSRNEAWKPKVKPPRLGGNKSIGVFATRSPNRPAPIGLSVIKLESIEQKKGKLLLNLSGVDLLDGTPVLDIKPYIPYVDKVCDAINEFAPAAPIFMRVTLSLEQQLFCSVFQQQTGTNLAELITQILQQDPRPQYQTPTADKIYGMKLLNLDLRWRYVIAAESCHIYVHSILVVNPDK